MNGPLKCSLHLDIRKIRQMVSGFENEIYFMISRTDMNSGLAGDHNYIGSWTRLWRYDDVLSKNFVYVYDEATYDKQSKFQGEIYVEKKPELRGSTLTLETNPNP